GLGKNELALDVLLKTLNQFDDHLKTIPNTWSADAGTIGDQIPIDQKSIVAKAYINHTLGVVIFNTGNTEQAETYFRIGYNLAKQIRYTVRWAIAAMNLGRCYLYRNKLDSALQFLYESNTLAYTSSAARYLANINTYTGDIFRLKNQKDSAFNHYYKAIYYGKTKSNFNGLLQAYFSIARFHREVGNTDSSLLYSNYCLQIIDKLGSNFTSFNVNKGSIYQNIYACFLLKQQKDSINKYKDLYLIQNDSIKQKRINALIGFQNTLLKNQLRLQELEKDKINSDNRNQTNLFIAGIILVIVVSILLFRSNRIKQKDNAALQKAFSDLKSTQTQLIQSEKMASLGELTAGIAHEIQNPLNFVNNFSELNNELLQELGPLDKLEVTADQQDILKDLQSNSEKINHHGQRAASIVKGMLQHSRSSSGQKEPTDINALCDEYLRLAYHGLRAKDKSFNAAFKTDFDASIPKVSIVPQDMGRVILNLINNAFFAVGERGKAVGGSHRVEAINSEEKGIPSGLKLTPYSPTVTVSTKNLGNKIEIRISDNGTGIPNEIKEKIFQPFFTTKPTGQGTGLGLSLAYDIVTKAHEGKLSVESELRKGTIFKIEIPMSP
ncbi:MAG: ATP-binding protein, partial [Sediminibacterium sp.]